MLRRVREVCLSAYAHQDVSFEKLIEELRPERDSSYTPIFQVYINMHSFEQGAMKLPGLEIKSVAIPLLSKFDLTLYVVEDPTGIDLSLVYSTELFDRPALAEMIEQLRHLCPQVAREPSKHIASYSLVTPESASHCPTRPSRSPPLGKGPYTTCSPSARAGSPAASRSSTRASAGRTGSLRRAATG